MLIHNLLMFALLWTQVEPANVSALGHLPLTVAGRVDFWVRLLVLCRAIQDYELEIPMEIMLIFAANCNVGGSGLSADVRYCIFGEDERAIEVPREGATFVPPSLDYNRILNISEYQQKIPIYCAPILILLHASNIPQTNTMAA